MSAFFLKKEFLTIILLIGLSLILLFPFFHYGFPPSHDGEYHVIRGYQFYKTLQDGNFYPRWFADLNKGYGTPLMNYFYPLPYYVMSLFHFAGFNFINSFKLEMIFATIIGTVFFFLWTRIFWGNIGGFVSAVVYTFSPYHIVDLYIRGALGEVLALAVFPGLLWTLTELIKNKKTNFLVPSALLLSLLIFANNILAVIFFPFAFLYSAVLIMTSPGRRKTLSYLLTVVLLGLGFSAIFWIPAIFERGYTRGLLTYNVYEHFPQLYQLLIPSWGSGFSNGNLANEISFQIGVVNIFAVFISIFVLLKLIKKNSKEAIYMLFFIASFFLVLFLMLNYSYPFWKFIPFSNYFQFPWRFLSLEIVISAFLIGSIIRIWSRKLVLAGVMVFLTIILTIGYITPPYYWEREDSYYFSRSNFMDSTSSPGFNTLWFNEDLKRTKERVVIKDGRGEIFNKNIKSTRYNFTVKSQTPVLVKVNTAYFPGWNVYVDGKLKQVKEENGLFSFRVPNGTHNVLVEFEDTSIRKLANILSLIFFAVMIFVLFKNLNFVKIRR
jgi:uncharacterized membrane protein